MQIQEDHGVRYINIPHIEQYVAIIFLNELLKNIEKKQASDRCYYN